MPYYLTFGDGWTRLPDDFDKPEFATVTIQRDLFYGYDTLMENVSDPSHIEFAHHKVKIFTKLSYISDQMISLADYPLIFIFPLL